VTEPSWCTVLVVGDDPARRETVVRALAKIECDLLHIHVGAARQLARTFRPMVIVVLDSAQAANELGEQMRTSEGLADSFIIAMHAEDDLASLLTQVEQRKLHLERSLRARS
jgi:CheY-like chemotaxis protein